MPRNLHLEYPGATYFLNDVDLHDFIKTLVEAWQNARGLVPACLNHEHERANPRPAPCLTPARQSRHHPAIRRPRTPDNMVDAVGTTRYTYNNVGQLLAEDGPWSADTVSYGYQNRLRTTLSLLQVNAYDVSTTPTSVTVKDNANPAQAAAVYADNTFAREDVPILRRESPAVAKSRPYWRD